ncbi:UNVERIFIED_CONTAM: Kinesin light chain 3 [Siphonaria sp. JEL0065]|nr:Kinesin light chain 3 [Siphonaria sp. JEL0065]
MPTSPNGKQQPGNTRLSFILKSSIGSFSSPASAPSKELAPKSSRLSIGSGAFSQTLSAATSSFRSRPSSLVSAQPTYVRDLRSDLSAAQNTEPSRSIAIDGLRFTYILALIQDWGGRSALQGKTTAQVCSDHVIRMTANSKNSVCEYVQSFPALSLNVRESNWFVSHVWEYKFLDVVDTLERFFIGKQIPLHEAVVWFDLFSLPQHDDEEERKFEWWNHSIMSVVKRIRNIVLVLEDWFDPVPLQRVWCVYEIFCSTMARSNFHIALSKSDETTLVNSLYENPSALYESLSTFKSELTRATKLRDQQMIYKVLRHFIGFHKLNDLVFTAIRHWIFEFVQHQIETIIPSVLVPETTNVETLLRQAQWYQVKSELYELRDMLPKAKSALSECLALREEHFGLLHPITLKTKSKFAHLSAQLGKNAYAESTLISCLSAQREVNGSSHRDTLLTMSRLAFVYGEQDLVEEAEVLYKECIATSVECFGENDQFVVSTNQDLANFYVTNDRLEDALPLYIQTYTKFSMLKGPEDSSALFSAIGIAEIQYSLENYSEAEKMYLEITEAVEETFGGESSFQYSKVRTGLAQVYKKQKRFDDASLILYPLVEIQQKAHGPNHVLTLETSVALACAYWDQGFRVKAESLLMSCLEKQKAILGSEDATTLGTTMLLAGYFKLENCVDQAEKLIVEVYKIQLQVLGTHNVDTLTTQMELTTLNFEDLNKISYAHELMKDALDKLVDVLGPSHKLVASATAKLAVIEKVLGV